MKDVYVTFLCENQMAYKGKKELNKWGDIPCSQIKQIIIINISVFPKLTYRLNSISFKM